MEHGARERAIGATVGFAVVALSNFFAWGSLPVSSLIDDARSPFAGLVEAMGAIPAASVELTAWTGSVSIGSFEMPNKLVLLAALAALALVWLRELDLWPSPRWAPMALVGYGLVHCGYLLAVLLWVQAGAKVGAGALVCVIGLMIMLRSSRRGRTNGSTLDQATG